MKTLTTQQADDLANEWRNAIQQVFCDVKVMPFCWDGNQAVLGLIFQHEKDQAAFEEKFEALAPEHPLKRLMTTHPVSKMAHHSLFNNTPNPPRPN